MGALQIVLDKGQEDDWFGSPFITHLAIVAAVALVALVVWELRRADPIVDLRLLASRNFAVGNMLMILVFAGATIALSLYIGRSWMGFAFRAVGEDESAAATLCINAGAYKLAAFGIGTALAGLAGGLYTFFTQFITADTFDFIFSVLLMAMVVIGGVGSTLGVVVGAVALTLLPEVIRFVNDYRLLVFGGLLVLVIRLAAGGLAGLARKLTLKVEKS